MKTAEDILKEKKRDIVCTHSNRSVLEASRIMAENNIGAILIEDGGRYVGIYSERDLLRHTASADFNPKTARIGDYMSSPLHCAEHDETLVNLKDKFLGLYIRHLIIEKAGKQIGLLSIGDVLRASLLEQDRQIKELNSMASWEYYENWGWDHKKRG